MKTKTTDQIVDEIMLMEKDYSLDTKALYNIDLTYFTKKYLDLLELRDLDYNIRQYATE